MLRSTVLALELRKRQDSRRPGAMVFNSLTFLVFFAIVWFLHQAPWSWRARKRNLLIASYVFYAAWNPPFVALIWLSTLVDWFAARFMSRSASPTGRRSWLLVSLVTNLGLLGFFKYGNFLLENLVAGLALVGISYQPPASDIILPVGISFYTFQTLSYTIDVYRRRMEPWTSFLDFALFVSFFPQLVAGPIVRASEFLPQCREPRRARGAAIGWGLTLLTLGLFEKIVLADHLLAPVADQVYGAASRAGFLDAWTGTLAFSAQIFFDFAGYSTVAIGVAMCLGFALPDNFRFPYAAIGFSDFWRRWHISLSGWLRDYLYIPLGGNRGGRLRTHANLMTTMLLGGLWHGASWQFVVWGGLHGMYLVVERWARAAGGHLRWVGTAWGRVALALMTYALVCVTWVFFRAQSFADAGYLVTAMLAGRTDRLVLGSAAVSIVAGITLGLLASHWYLRDTTLEDRWSVLPWWAQSGLTATLLFLILLTPGTDRAFIYFQF